MKEKWSSVHYDDVVIYRCQPEDILTERIVLKILDECDEPLKVWFEDLAVKRLMVPSSCMYRRYSYINMWM